MEPRTPTVLVIDDDPSLRRAVARVLRREAWLVIEGSDGRDGLILAEEGRPDLVLTDARMPEFDGLSLCRELKRPGRRSVPVVIMSGELMDPEEVVDGFESGADDYLLKPFSMEHLVARLRAVLSRGRGVEQALRFH